MTIQILNYRLSKNHKLTFSFHEQGCYFHAGCSRYNSLRESLSKTLYEIVAHVLLQ